jgi:TadE-like protein
MNSEITGRKINALRRRTGTARRGRGRRAAAVVEMAMCLPVLMLLLFGAYEFARANMIRHAINAAAYEGARSGIVPGAKVADVQASARYILSTVGVRDFRLRVEPNPIRLRDKRVRVEIEVRLRDNTLMPILFNERTRLRGSCELKREGGF